MASKQSTHAPGDTILVSVDFSSYSKKALRVGARLSEKLDAQLVILHVIHDPAHRPGYYNRVTKKNALPRLEDGAKEMMGEFLSRAAKDKSARAAIERAQIEMVVGTPVNRILELEERLEPLMLVLGSQGRTGLERILIGSKAEQLTRLCRGPVLIVKD